MFKIDIFAARVIFAFVVLASVVSVASADIFGSGGNQFAIDFVQVSGATNPSAGIPAGNGFTFTGVANDYRMGTMEITNGQWDAFRASLGFAVTGSPLSAYDQNAAWTGANLPASNVSWYEAAQFVNWLNTSTGHHAAYMFTGVQGQSSYTLGVWNAAEADNGTNLYRHKDAMYYLPTEDEWVKAAYWNGAALQTHATKPGESLHMGDGLNGSGWNYYNHGYATNPPGPWAVGSGSEELNGTFDMMGNVREWIESPYNEAHYVAESDRGLRGGSYQYDAVTGGTLESTDRQRYSDPQAESHIFGFRVAADIPEPCVLMLLSAGAVMLGASVKDARRRRSA